ncbi:NADP-specific glutamate dehydrogenase [Algoriphagus yeomjeoni]|uniref:Glutamate dehydrogenase n=1 Tax=Algoriphagus yeomjeoni TaxID=291403 RepID=A0A327P6N7_9BACT|nr:NADP-specific glutamate dehydrogenase [Algoriphagus yeomjeoni]RAI87919.1 glutamate dehydrogenase (NADP+) [Algoriphagus yeomjeoni]
MSDLRNKIIEILKQRDPNDTEFIQAVQEVIPSVSKVLEKHPEFDTLKIMERMIEPERVVTFRVAWKDDQGEVQVNRGYRVQMNSAIGPYKGGLRFHPSVNISILKFLAFEQIFKNALTNLPMGGGKGGSDFDPKGKSDNEIMRFCFAFMQELFRHLGDFTDVPAGDIGVGSREIGYLFGMYKKLQNKFTGIITGKGEDWGGSVIRPEATGYGLIYFASNMLEVKDDSIKDKKCLVSGAGNVAQFAIEKIIALGGIPISISDSSGYIIDKDGIDTAKLDFIKKLKNEKRGRIKEYADKYPESEYHETKKDQDFNPLWKVKASCVFPCATQNEINEQDAKNLVSNEIILLAEGANMPCSTKAIEILQDSKVLYAPGKSSNAGGVAVSGLEMSQNRQGVYMDRDEVDQQLKNIMKDIHDECLKTAEAYGVPGNYLEGANIFAFSKVARAMQAQGVV